MKCFSEYAATDRFLGVGLTVVCCDVGTVFSAIPTHCRSLFSRRARAPMSWLHPSAHVHSFNCRTICVPEVEKDRILKSANIHFEMPHRNILPGPCAASWICVLSLA